MGPPRLFTIGVLFAMAGFDVARDPCTLYQDAGAVHPFRRTNPHHVRVVADEAALNGQDHARGWRPKSGCDGWAVQGRDERAGRMVEKTMMTY